MVGATLVALLLLAASALLFATAFFGTGCAFTERVVDRTILSSPEMRFDDLDPDRDLPGGGFGGGGVGGGGAGAC